MFEGRWGLNPPPYLYENIKTGEKCFAKDRRDALKIFGLTRNQGRSYMNNLGRKSDKGVCTMKNKNTEV